MSHSSGPRVLILHPVPSVDISDAARYGRFHYASTSGYLFADEVDNLQVPEQLLKDLKAAAIDFHPVHDYLLIAGDHVQLALMSALLANRYPFFKLLRYDRRHRAYFPVEIPGRTGVTA